MFRVAPLRKVLVGCVFAGLSVFSTIVMADELTQEKQGREREEDTAPFFVGIDALFGFRPVEHHNKAMSESLEEENQPRERTVKSFVFSAGYDVSQHFTIGARLPLTYATFEFSDREQKHLVALGNLELAPTYDIEVGHRMELTFDLGIALPTATGDEFSEQSGKRRTAYANLAASRFRGFRNNALFASHRLGFVPGAEFEIERGGLQISVFTKLEILVHAGGATPAPIEGKINEIAFESVTGFELFGSPAPELLSVGIQSWLTHTAVGEVKFVDVPGEKRPGTTQVMLMPEVRIFAGSLRSDIGVLVPISGPLGDWKYLALRTGLSTEF